MADQPNAEQHDCIGKYPYDSFTLAEKVAGRAQRKHVRAGSYHCPVCKKWHVGHRFGNRKKR